MRSVQQGGSITFDLSFTNSSGVAVDPADPGLTIYLNGAIWAGPYLYVAGNLTKLATGRYRLIWQVPAGTPLAVFTARQSGTVEGVDQTTDEIFQVIPAIEAEERSPLSPPVIRGAMTPSPLYNTMGIGLTDNLFIIGHADGLPLNDPYKVTNVQHAINVLHGNTSSPLLRGLLEAYYAGARDVTLVASAPMREYVPELDDRTTAQSAWGGKNFYEQYYTRLAATFSLLKSWDNVDIIVPLETSFYGTGATDFYNQLANHCVESFQNTGKVRMGFLGSRGALTESVIDTMTSDTRLDNVGTEGKFVCIVAGDVTVNYRELTGAYATSAAVIAAAVTSTLPLDRGLTHTLLPNVITPNYGNPTKAQIKQLTESKINPVIRTAAGRRATAYQAVLATDNTVAQDGSDYWSLVQLRLSAKVISRLQDIGRSYIGSIELNTFRDVCQQYLLSLSNQGLLRDFQIIVRRSELNYYKVIVDVVLKPFYGLREIVFNVEVGPND